MGVFTANRFKKRWRVSNVCRTTNRRFDRSRLVPVKANGNVTSVPLTKKIRGSINRGEKDKFL